ncbi:nickel-binding protein [Nocardia jejuensis]|uniref:nickel-binding protein n=1 Tax=Nocardia jejuensis TaxID=328049 RepID=UPI00082EFF95|nr:nickel-binding protein [Nocardia jejuensis]
MPLFIDIHTLPEAVDLDQAAEAHAADLAAQAEHGVDYQRYWLDTTGHRIFCLVSAPDAEAAAHVHKQAHGLVADEIYEVHEGK